jgi:hypothetical protein
MDHFWRHCRHLGRLVCLLTALRPGAYGVGAYTSVGQVGYGEGCEPLLQHLVVHDDDSSPWVVAGLMMDWPGLPAGSSAGIGHIDGLRRGALCLQERVG